MQPPLRILVVEDNPGDVRLLEEMLSVERLGSYQLAHVGRLDLALKKLTEGGVDIALLDLGLPDGQGMDIVRQVRKVAPQLPLIVLTGQDNDAMVAGAMREGVQDYLVKGQIENRALPRALNYAIERFGLLSKVESNNVELEGRIREKEVLLREIHHRVKNNLQVISSLLSMEARTSSDDGTVAMLRATQNRVLTIAAVHQTLYESKNLARVDFEGFLRLFVPSLIRIYSIRENQIALTIDVKNCVLPIDQAIPCGLIVNELVSNALKHAFPEGRGGSIRIEYAREGERSAALTVCNDGVELPQSFSFQNRKTLGMQLIDLLSRQIHGKATVSRAEQTCFRLQFPLILESAPPASAAIGDREEAFHLARG